MELTNYDPANIAEIKQLFTASFSDSEGRAEGLVIGKLVDNLLTGTDSRDLYCFVAKNNGKFTGGIIFSRLFFESQISAFILSPVAVHTIGQGKGIGQKLINYGLDVIRKNAVELAFTYGDPRYYTKVGFNPVSENLVKAPHQMSQPQGWLGQSLSGGKIKPQAGRPRCVAALDNPDFW